MVENSTSSPSVLAQTRLVWGRPLGSMVATATWLGWSNSSLAIPGSVILSVTVIPRPTPRVLGILNRRCAVRQLQRAERIDHDGRLVGCRAALLHPPYHGLDRSRDRAVRKAGRVQGDRADADAGTLPRRIVAAHVEHHLV